MSVGKHLLKVLAAVASRIGRVQAWLLLTLCYFVILAPVAVIFRCAADPLRLRRTTLPLWTPRRPPPDLWTWAKGQA